MRMRVRSLASLSGSRIWCCPELWCRSQTWLASGVAVAVAVAVTGSCSSLSTSSLETSICHRCNPKKKMWVQEKAGLGMPQGAQMSERSPLMGRGAGPLHPPAVCPWSWGPLPTPHSLSRHVWCRWLSSARAAPAAGGKWPAQVRGLMDTALSGLLACLTILGQGQALSTPIESSLAGAEQPGASAGRQAPDSFHILNTPVHVQVLLNLGPRAAGGDSRARQGLTNVGGGRVEGLRCVGPGGGPGSQAGCQPAVGILRGFRSDLAGSKVRGRDCRDTVSLGLFLCVIEKDCLPGRAASRIMGRNWEFPTSWCSGNESD